MKALTPVKVTAADRLDDAIIITFSDGKCGVYSSHLLYSVLASAQKLYEAFNAEM